ncbi:hypothetical protein VPH35_036694 [Triticum aestivum]
MLMMAGSRLILGRRGHRLPAWLYTAPVRAGAREQRWLIFPDGERGWDHHQNVRRPNSVLGVLCRQNFLGFVTLPGEGRLPELGLSWEHYMAAPAPPGEIIDGVLCDTTADVVTRKFWTFYRYEEGYEEDAANVIDNVCKRLLQNLRHKAQVQAVRDYYALRGIKKTKPACREKFLSKEEYMKAPPRWCADRMDCWEVLVNEWCSTEWLAVHNEAKDKCAQMEGVPHHQGSSKLYQFGWNWARYNKADKVPEVYDLYAMAHTASYKKVKAFSPSDLDDPNNFTNISSHDKLVKYRDQGKARKGEDFNLSQGPIDPELVMIAGGGRSHGSIAIGDGLIRCPSTLPEIKARRSKSAPEIRPHERPVQLAFKAAIQSERDRMEKLLAEAAERQQELEERTAKMLEEERARNDMQARAMYDLLVSVCEKAGQTAPPMPEIAPGTTRNSRQASHDPSRATGTSQPAPTPP